MTKKRPVFGPELPNATDVAWEQLSAPLLSFLAQARDWKELRAWGRAHRYTDMKLRNCLAWLALQNKARAAPTIRDGKKQWVWMGANAISPPVPGDEPTKGTKRNP